MAKPPRKPFMPLVTPPTYTLADLDKVSANPKLTKTFEPTYERVAFTLGDLKRVPAVRDKDNAAPRVPPPQNARLDHPRLAPPGMVGIMTSKRLGLPPSPKVERSSEPRQPGDVKRAFKALVKTSPGKARTHDR